MIPRWGCTIKVYHCRNQTPSWYDWKIAEKDAKPEQHKIHFCWNSSKPTHVPSHLYRFSKLRPSDLLMDSIWIHLKILKCALFPILAEYWFWLYSFLVTSYVLCVFWKKKYNKFFQTRKFNKHKKWGSNRSWLQYIYICNQPSAVHVSFFHFGRHLYSHDRPMFIDWDTISRRQADALYAKRWLLIIWK